MQLFGEERFKSKQHYIAYQEIITERHLIPLFQRLDIRLDRPFLDVGCGSGGCVLALASYLHVHGHGVDLSSESIAVGNEVANARKIDATFEVADLTKDPLPKGNFGLILMRDVVEHLSDVGLVLKRLRDGFDREGRLYITFPPWRGPYAGHQHNTRPPTRFMLYAHVLAPAGFLKMVRRRNLANESWLADAQQIFANRLTRRRFEQLASEAGWDIRYRQTYFLRPAFMRAGLPTVPNGFVGRLPVIGEPLTTACEYLLAPRLNCTASIEQPPTVC